MAANKIYLEVVFASQDAQQNIVELNKKIKGIGDAAEEGSKKANTNLKSVAVTVESTTRAFESMGTALAGLGIAKVGKELLGLGIELNRIEQAVRAIPGAPKGLQDLAEFARQSAFSIDVLYENFNKLRTLGVPAAKAADSVKTIAIAIANTTRSQDDFNNAISAFGQLSNKEFPTAKALFTQFATTGINVMELLRQATGRSVQQIRADVRTMSTDALQNMIILQLKINNLKATDTTGNLTAGLARLKTSFGELGQELDKTLSPSLMRVVILLTKIVDLAADAVKELGKLPQPVKDVAVIVGAGGVGAVGTAATVGTAMAVGRYAKAGYAGIRGWLGGAAAAGAGAAAGTAAGAAATGTAGAGAATLFATEVASGPPGWVIALTTIIVATVLAYLASSGSDKKVAGGSTLPQSEKDQEIARLKAELAKASGSLYTTDEAKVTHDRLVAANLLSEAQKKYYMVGKESIEALTYEYQEHFRAIGKDAKANSDMRLAFEKAIDTEIRKMDEERRKDSIKAQEELLALRRKTAVTALSVIPDQTYSGRQRVAEGTANEFEEQLRRQTYIANAEYDRQKQQQIDALKELKKDTASVEKDMADHRVEQNAIADEKVKEHTLVSQRETNILLAELDKERRQAQADYRQAGVAAEREQLLAAAQLRQAQTLPQRLEQIKTVESIELASIEKMHKARLDALDTEAEAMKKLARDAGNQAGVEEIDERYGTQRAQMRNQKEADLQMARFNAWKETDAAILEEQKSMYASMKSAADQMWSAFTDRTQSIWKSIGNAMKAAIMGAIKDITTSRLAAGLTELFGGGPVSFEGGRRGILGNRPVFSGNPAERPEVAPWTAAQSTLITSGHALDRSAILLSNAARDLAGAAAAIGGGSRFGSAARYMEDQSPAQAIAQSQSGGIGGADLPTGTGGTYSPSPPYTGSPGVTTPPFIAQATQAGGYNPRTGSYGSSLANAARTFGIGGPIQRVGGSGSVTTVPWEQGTTMEQLATIAKSPGAMSLALGTGVMIAMAGLQRGGVAGNAQTVGGAALAGIGAASMFPALGLTYLGGGLLGAGVGLAAAGLQRGGKVGLAMSVGGGALAGAVAGTAIFPGIGTAVGALIGAGIGAVAGVIRLVSPTLTERVPKEIKRIYGVTITDRGVIQQIVDIVKSKYGGNLSLAVYSQEIQDLVRLYALSVGQSQSGLPRPMYGATFAQSGAGGLQLQSVYSGGQVVESPYTGTTTTQLSNSLLNNPLYLQLDPAQAQQLFEGRVTQVLGNNPAAVSAANTAAARNGQGRVAQSASLMEPLTVMR